MRVPVLRTLSARILLGFAVLILTFGGTTIVQIWNNSILGRSIQAVRTVYVPMALYAKELEAKQNDLWHYLDEIRSEPTKLRVEARIRGFRAIRAKLIRDMRKITSKFLGVPGGHRTYVLELHQHLDNFEARIAANEADWAALLAAPPVEGTAEDPAAVIALARLKESEGRLYSDMLGFMDRCRELVEATALHVEASQTRIGTLTILFGVLAALVGLAVTLWVTWTLRPLRRLQLAARNIAAGDYGSRIEEVGPSEVADLAREFNSMGQAVEERQRDVVRAERLAAVGKMAATITHEVRNPLSAIGLNTELLEEELADIGANDEAKSLCRAIQKEVDRLTDITEEYLSFARLPKPKLHPHDVNAVVESMLDFQREQLGARGVQLDVQLAGAVPRIEMDDGQIRQALLNLIRNAADAVSESGNGHVTVQTRMAGRKQVELVVTDDGPGMTEDMVAKVFDPFFSTKEGGTGLGLALVQQIIHEHGGTIRVESEPGHGASFVVSLPA